MKVVVSETKEELGRLAGKAAADLIRQTIDQRGEANVILATGTSQFDTLKELVSQNVDWSKVTMFHLDEYVGMSETHPASFKKYLKERFLDKVGPLKASHLIDGTGDPEARIAELGKLIDRHPIDVALVGIGENGHLAFNDPPADFQTEQAYLIVSLDEPCRLQQMGEGWFTSLEQVPLQAISMSVRQIMKSRHIICSVPDERKAPAVRDSLQQPVSPHYPASILQEHSHCEFYLNKASASLLAGALTA